MKWWNRWLTDDKRAVRTVPLIEELEPRVLLSADAAGVFAPDPGGLQQQTPTELVLDDNLEPAPTQQVAQEESRSLELVFVDTDSPDYQTIIDSLTNSSDGHRQFEVILLDNNRDGVWQVSQALQNYSDVDAIHLVSHGDSEGIDLGNTRLDATSLQVQQDQFMTWSAYLADDADILIYGCNLAGADSGLSLMRELAQLTGADVAASEDLTGHASLGGDWVLEARVGEVDTQVFASNGLLQSYRATLAAPVANDDDGSTSYAEAAQADSDGYFRLGDAGDIADETAGGNDGSVQGGVTTGTGSATGDGDGSLDLNGSTGYVVIPHSTDYELTEGAISLWFNSTTIADGDTLFSKDASGTAEGGHLTVSFLNGGNGSEVRVRLQNNTSSGTDSHYVTSNVPNGYLNDGNWHNVVFTFGPAGMALYIDGQLEDTDTYDGGMAGDTGMEGDGGDTPNEEPIYLGASRTTSATGLTPPGGGYFQGAIDELAIINTQLDASEVAALYATPGVAYEIDEDSTLTVSASNGVLRNDTDADDDPLTASLVSGPSNAQSFTLNSDGSFTYTPLAQFSGTDSFVYQVDDGNGGTDTATATITINAVADDPAFFDYQHSVTLSAATPSANYPVRIDLSEGVNGFAHANAQANGEDLRFFDSNGAQLDYWIEEWNNAGSTTVWVEVADAGETTIDLYYGSASAIAQSDGTATFDYFDDFNDETVGNAPSGWTATGDALVGTPPSVQVLDDEFVFYDGANDGDAVLHGGTWADSIIRQQFRVQTSGDDISDATVVFRYQDANNAFAAGIHDRDTVRFWYNNSGWSQVPGSEINNVDATLGYDLNDGNWHTQEIRVAGDTVEVYIDDVFIGSADYSGIAGLPASGAAGFWSQDGNEEGYRDNHQVLAFDAATGAITGTVGAVVSTPTFTIDENSANATTVGTVNPATDADGDSLSYSITAGNTGAWAGDAFAIDGSGVITVNNSDALNFEDTPTFNLTVEINDGTARTDTLSVTVNLNDINDPATGPLTVTLLESDGDSIPEVGERLWQIGSPQDEDGVPGTGWDIQWLRDGVPIVGANGIMYTLVEADVGAQITLSVSFTDDGGSFESLQGTPSAIVGNDRGADIVSVQTVDLNEDGFIDGLHITFDDDIQDSTVRADDFDVAGVLGESFSSTTNMDVADDNDIYITFNDGVLGTGATPQVTYLGDDPTDPDILDSSGTAAANFVVWWNTDWQNRTRIDIDNSAAGTAVQDFPLLIELTGSDIDFSKVGTNGEDLRFVNSDGNPLAYTFESFNSVAETARIWVRVDELAAGAADEAIYLYYNNSGAADEQNAAAVWADGLAVYHFNEDPGPGGAGDILDSSSSANNGTAEASMDAADLVSGQVGTAIDFDGGDDHINFSSIGDEDVFTISAWIRPDAGTGIKTIMANSAQGASTDGFRFFINSSGTSDGTINFETGNGLAGGGSANSTAGVIDVNQWNHIAVEVDRVAGTATIYHNGVDVTSDGTIRDDFTVDNNFRVGEMLGGTLAFEGVIDELRIESVAQTADFIQARYLSQGGSNTFTRFGAEESQTTDTAAPVAAITRDQANPTNAGSVTFSVDFSEDVINVSADDFQVVTTGTVATNPTVAVNNAGDADDSTYQVTVSGITGNGTVGLEYGAGLNIEDAVGNLASEIFPVGEVYTIDNIEPTIDAVALDDSSLVAGQTTTLTITFSEAVTNFDNGDISLDNGTLTPVSSSDGGVTWTGTFTPTDDIEDTSNLITVGTTLTDIAGNAPLASRDSANYTIDTREPVINSVALGDSSLTVGETTTLTITFSEAVNNFDNGDISLANGTLTPVSSSDGGVTWTGTFTPTDDIEDTSNIITVGTTLTDLAGNAPTASRDSANYTIDTREPVINSVALADSSLSVGETTTLTITFSEAVNNFDNGDITLANGTLTPVSTSNGGVTWTGTFTPTDDIEDTSNIITVGTTLTDLAGNAPQASRDSANYSIDTREPLAAAVTGISNDSGVAGDGITNDNTLVIAGNAEASSSVEVFVDGGSIGTTTADAFGDWSFNYTGTTLADGGYTLTAQATDAAGNTGPVSAGFAIDIDNDDPTIDAVTLDDPSLVAGQTTTLTITFSEAVNNFDNTDISLDNGTLTPVSSSDGGVTWTGTFTPTDDIEDTSNIITVGTTLTDLAGNAPLASRDSANYSIDTREPVINSVVLDDTSLSVGETTTLTITFSEAVTNFDNGDITLANGTLTPVSTSNGGVTWTGTFTPTDDIEDTSNIITVGTTLTDLAGNAPTASRDSANYSIDTREPTIDAVALDDSSLVAGQTTTLTITFSEAVTNFDNGDISLDNGTLTPVSSSDGGVTWTGTFTPTDDIEDTSNLITVGTTLTDIAGNAPLASRDSANYTIDTREPVINSVALGDSSLTVGETTTLTITFSEAVNNFDNGDISLANGTLTPVSSSDGGVTWTGTFTPTDDIEDTSNIITVGTTLTDLAGNAPTASRDSANYTIDTREPVINSVALADSSLSVGETTTLTITFSEAVNNFDNGDITLANGTLTPVSTSNGGVTWTGTFTPTDDIEDTSNIITVGTTLTDLAGNAPQASRDSANYSIDTREPLAAAVTGISNDSGVAGDGITNDNTLVIAGNAEASSSVEVFVDGGSIGTTTADAFGDWSFNYTGTTLADGGYTLTAQATDAAGNTGPVSAGFAIDIDTGDPGAPTVLSISDDTGAADNITSDNQLVFAGSAEADSSVEVFINGSSIGTTLADALGDWTFDHSATTLANASYTLTAEATDLAGNTSTVSAGFNFTVDAAGPAAAVTGLSTDSGLADNITTDNQLEFSGTAEAGNSVEIFLDSVSVATVIADGSGDWSFDYTGTTLADGSYTLTAQATDGATAQVGAISAAFNFTVDTVAPTAAVTAITDDTAAADGITSDTRLEFSGTAEAGNVVEVFLDAGSGAVSLGTTTADGAGAWRFDHTGTVLAEGNYTLTAQATDNATGLTGPVSSGFDIVINTAPPANNPPTGDVSINNATPAEGDTLTASNTLSDFDGIPSLDYHWQRDTGSGFVDIGVSGATYTATQEDVGATLRVEARYTDVRGFNEAVASSATAAVENVDDAGTGDVSIDNLAPVQGDTLTASNTLDDPDGLSGGVAYQWQRDGVDIAGQNGTIYITTQADVGAVISVVASYIDDFGGTGSVASVSTAAVADSNDGPAGDVTIGGLATEDQTLTASNTLTDPDGMGTVSYQWQRDGVDISGAVGESYTLSQQDVGSQISVIASYVDGEANNESLSSGLTAAVTNINDLPSGTLLATPSDTTAGTVLTVNNDLLDEDGISGLVSLQWMRDGTAIAGATGSSYTLSDDDVGTTVTVVASYTDDFGTAETLESTGVLATGGSTSGGEPPGDDTPAEETPDDGTPGDDSPVVDPFDDGSPTPVDVPADGPGSDAVDEPGGVNVPSEPAGEDSDPSVPIAPPATDDPLAAPPTLELSDPVLDSDLTGAPVLELGDDLDIGSRAGVGTSIIDLADSSGGENSSDSEETEAAIAAAERDRELVEDLLQLIQDVDSEEDIGLSAGVAGNVTIEEVLQEDEELAVVDDILTNHALWDAIDRMNEEMASQNETTLSRDELVVQFVSTSGLGLFAAITVYALRGGALMASWLSTVPLWGTLDPLPVLRDKKEEEQELEERDKKAKRERSAESMFAGQESS